MHLWHNVVHMVAMQTENGVAKSENGKFVPTYPEEEFLAAADGGAVTSTVGEAVGCNKETARYRLKKLEQEGKVERVRIGTADLWSLVNSE